MRGVTECIVLTRTMYGEHSAIVNALSPDLGTIAFMVRGLGSRKRNKHKSQLSPLTVLEISYSRKREDQMLQVNEMKRAEVYHNISTDVVKGTIVMFLGEILSKSMTESHADPVKFKFLKDGLRILDNAENASNFHIWFLLSLAKYLGFEPDSEGYDNNASFDLVEGAFTLTEPPHPYFTKKEISPVFKQFMEASFEQVEHFRLKADDRRQLLHDVVRYYELHLQTISDLRSLDVLETVFA